MSIAALPYFSSRWDWVEDGSCQSSHPFNITSGAYGVMGLMGIVGGRSL